MRLSIHPIPNMRGVCSRVSTFLLLSLQDTIHVVRALHYHHLVRYPDQNDKLASRRFVLERLRSSEVD